MREGWTYKKLGEVADVVHGKNQKDVLSENGQYPIYGSGGNIMGYANDYLCEAGATILGRKGSINNPQYIEERFWNVDTAFGISAKEGNDSKFIYYFITSVDWLKKNTGTTLPSLTQQVVKSVEMPVPSLKEQKRIVERLDAAFAHIDELKANAEKQLTEARALFQKGLTKVMEPKVGWEEKKLKDIAQVRIGPFGSLLHKKDYISGGIPLVNPIHMIGGKIVANNDYTISDGKAKELSNYLLKVNDIVFARRGEVGRCALVSKDEEGYLCGTGSMFVRFNDDVDFAFMLMLFQSERCREYLKENASGATMLNINAGIVENMPLILPSFAEQQRIVARLDSLSENVRKYEEIQRKVISECDALKQALLRKVFE